MARYTHGNLAVDEQVQKEAEQFPRRSDQRSGKRGLRMSEKRLYLLIVLIFVAISIPLIASQAMVFKLNLQMDDMEGKIKQLQRDNAELKLKMTELADPDAIRTDAEAMGLFQADVKEIKRIGFVDTDQAEQKYATIQQ